MTNAATLTVDFGPTFAQKLSQNSDDNWIKVFHDLRKSGQLSSTIRQINIFLNDPEHRTVAEAALRRIGLEYGG